MMSANPVKISSLLPGLQVETLQDSASVSTQEYYFKLSMHVEILNVGCKINFNSKIFQRTQQQIQVMEFLRRKKTNRPSCVGSEECDQR